MKVYIAFTSTMHTQEQRSSGLKSYQSGPFMNTQGTEESLKLHCNYIIEEGDFHPATGSTASHFLSRI